MTNGGGEGTKAKGYGWAVYGDPHTDPAVGPRAGVSPIGKIGGGRRT